MGCRSDYMEPSQAEITLSRILWILDNLKNGTPIPKQYLSPSGYNPEAYGSTTQERLDKETARLCNLLSKLKPEFIAQQALEVQLWWRDHQDADKKRLQADLDKIKTEEEKNTALSKLTPHERKLLGFNG